MKRKKCKKEKYEVHFGEDDFWINGFRFNAVHIIPKIPNEITEVDFYMDTGEEICLLRVRNSPLDKITFCQGEITYIIIEKTLQFENKKRTGNDCRNFEKSKNSA